MLRLIHNQTCSNAILVDDIDDGLPNKEVHRLGTTADPKAYPRDGYANKPKQPVYVPRTKLYPIVVGGPPSWYSSIQGYIDLDETERVTLSAGKGKIKKLQTSGFITVVSFVAADVLAPTISPGGAQIDTPGLGDLTITGTKLASLTPNTSTVIITGTGAVVLTQAQILGTVGGVVSDTSIVVPAALFTVPIAAPGSSAQVRADDQLSNVLAVV